MVAYPCPLEAKPVVKAVAIATHGPRTVERFAVGDLWCLHLYRYQGRVKIGADSFPITPGSIGITPPGALAEYVFDGRSTHGYVHFETPAGPQTELAPMLPAGKEFGAAWESFEEALGVFPRQPLRAEVKVWDLLLAHAERTQLQPSAEGALHPAVSQALKILETRMAGEVTVAGVAEEVGVSHNHLTRLFRQHLGKTVVAYLIERRLERAEHLLKRSTMPVKQIAAQVGIPDLQAFNKAVRAKFGASPREVRAEANLEFWNTRFDALRSQLGKEK